MYYEETRISYARMLIEVNVTKSIPQQITVMDPNGRTFLQEVVMEWKPQYCDKCQDWTPMSISNTGGDTKEEKALEKSNTDLAI